MLTDATIRNPRGLVNFTVNDGDRFGLPSSRGPHMNPVIVSYTPEMMGSGTSIDTAGDLTCSGVFNVSPSSYNFGDAYPVIQEIFRRRGMAARTVMMIHDSLWGEAAVNEQDEVRHLMSRMMTTAAKLRVPLVIDFLD